MSTPSTMMSTVGSETKPICYQVFEAGITAAADNLFDKAGVFFRQVITLQPSFLSAHVNLGAVLWTQRKPDQAAAAFQKALDINPRCAEALMNLGIIYAETNQLDQAVDYIRRAMTLNPTGMGYGNLGTVYRQLGKRAQALQAYRAAVTLTPDDDYYVMNYGMELLLIGRFEEGWRYFAHRLKHPYAHSTFEIAKDKRVWDGEHVHHLVIHHEQGVGDTIQASRYINEAVEHCDHLTFVPQAELVSLMQHNFKDNQKITVSEYVPDEYDAYQWVDMLMMRAGVDPIPTDPYLFAPKTTRWRHLSNLPGLKVGLVWAGRTEQVVDKRRTMPFEFAHKLFDLPGISFVSLQKDRTEAHPKLYDAAPYLNDWKATAGAMNALDLIISVDTAAAHLAGALGKPVWLMNRFDTCWRWQLDRTDSPWYPSMRIFRQPRANDWAALIDEVCIALVDLQKKSTDINPDTK